MFFFDDKNLQRESNFRKTILNIERALKNVETQESNTEGQNYYF